MKARRARFERTSPIPTVRSTWFSGRIDSASMTGAMSHFWSIAPRTKRTGMTMRSETYGSIFPSVNAQNVTYIPTIISSPCARLMIFMTPMIRDIPSPIRA